MICGLWYIHDLVRTPDGWRIALRRCTVEMSVEGGAEFVHSPAVKGFLRGVWDSSDPSYQRPLSLDGIDETRW